MSLVSNVLQSAFRCVARHTQRVAPLFSPFSVTHCDVLQSRSVARSGAEKVVSTEWFGGQRHSATLLLFKINIITYVHTYAYVHRGSIGTGFEMLRPRSVVSA